jgi:tetratricopeptide (TPR) repeat protein
MLRSAAAEASARGAPHAAITFLERVIAEPPGSEAGQVLFELGLAAHAALEITKAVDALTQALHKCAPTDRGRVALALARVLIHAGPAQDAVRLLRAQLDASAAIDLTSACRSKSSTFCSRAPFPMLCQLRSVSSRWKDEALPSSQR